MELFVVIAAVLLSFLAIYLVKNARKEIPVFINGLVPSRSDNPLDKKDKGTTVYIFFDDDSLSKEDKEIFLGSADTEGRITSSVPKSSVGKDAIIRIRHAAFLNDEFRMQIPWFGIIYTARMRPDGNYNGEIHGANISNYSQYEYESRVEANKVGRINESRANTLINGIVALIIILLTTYLFVNQISKTSVSDNVQENSLLIDKLEDYESLYNDCQDELDSLKNISNGEISYHLLNVMSSNTQANDPEANKDEFGDEDSRPFQNLRYYLYIGIYSLLALILIGSWIVTVTNDDDKKVLQAANLVKYLLGFFIGVATSLFSF